jgi:hypothetical protein
VEKCLLGGALDNADWVAKPDGDRIARAPAERWFAHACCIALGARRGAHIAAVVPSFGGSSPGGGARGRDMRWSCSPGTNRNAATSPK